MSAAPLIAVCTASVLLAGCATSPPADPALPVPTPAPPAAAVTRPYPWPDEPPAPIVLVEQSALVRALDYYSRIRQRPVREQRSEFDSLRKTFSTSRSDFDRMRLALLLSLPNTGFGDDIQVLELLEPLARDAGSDYYGLAHLLTLLLTEQRRLDRQSAALQQKLERIRALEKEMQQRAVTPESKRR